MASAHHAIADIDARVGAGAQPGGAFMRRLLHGVGMHHCPAHCSRAVPRPPAIRSTTACCATAPMPTATTASARPSSQAWSPGTSRGSSRISPLGARGTTAGDDAGHEMRPVALRLRNEGLLADAVKFISSLESRRPAPTVDGDVAQGRRLYAACAACHGAEGEGNVALQSPALAARSDWYLVIQLSNYKSRIARHRPARYLRRADARHRGDAARRQGHQRRGRLHQHPEITRANQCPDKVRTYIITIRMSPVARHSVALASSARRRRMPPRCVRHSLGPNNNFPIARAVEVPAGKTIYLPQRHDAGAARSQGRAGTPEYWGDTKTQTLSVFDRLKESLKSLGLGFGDVVAMTVYLVRRSGQGRAHGFRRHDGCVHAVLRHQGAAQPAGAFDRAGGRAWWLPACWSRSRCSSRSSRTSP